MQEHTNLSSVRETGRMPQLIGRRPLRRRRLRRLACSALRTDVDDILASDQHGVVMRRDTVTREGVDHSLEIIHIYDLRYGPISEVASWVDGQDAFRQAQLNGRVPNPCRS